jgi:hypothetical protein
MARHRGRDASGRLQLERTGPFVPPISFPGAGDVIVTDPVRKALNRSGLTGLEFVTVRKARIVRFDWHLWDLAAEDPREYPDSGEPESYLLDRPHCTETAAAIGKLWELRVGEGIAEIRSRSAIKLRQSSWSGADFFRGTETRWTFVSPAARSWLRKHVAGSVRFAAVASV